MITIPLRLIVTFLQRTGDDLTCLEGAPMLDTDEATLIACPLLVGDDLYDAVHPDAPKMHAPFRLYIGRGPICPAALGWIGRVRLLTYGDNDVQIAGVTPAERVKAELLRGMAR